ncbi:unnamed protein product, partial [Amoebophrya sp. A120]
PETRPAAARQNRGARTLRARVLAAGRLIPGGQLVFATDAGGPNRVKKASPGGASITGCGAWARDCPHSVPDAPFVGFERATQP